MVHRIRVEAFKLIRREQDTPLVTLNLSEEVLLLIIMSWCHIPYTERKDDKQDTLSTGMKDGSKLYSLLKTVNTLSHI